MGGIQVAPSLKGNISFTLEERFEKTGPGFESKIFVTGKSEEIIQNHGETLVKTSVKRTGNNIRVSFGKIETAGCDTCPSAAPSEFWFFPDRKGLVDGEYTLELEKEGLIDKYNLSKKGNNVTISPIKTSFSKNLNSFLILHELPKNIMAAECSFSGYHILQKNKSSVVDHCQNFFKAILNISEPYIVSSNLSKNSFFIYGGSNLTLIKLAREYNRPYFRLQLVRWNSFSILCQDVYCHTWSSGSKFPTPQLTDFQFPRILNESSCYEITYNDYLKADCFQFISLMSNDSNICLLIKNSSLIEACYLNYADKSGDRSVCDRIKEREICLNRVRDKLKWYEYIQNTN
ncbi:MAG: hypothetical protein AABX51_06530 [Nanoarchaeota archaeon]